MGRWFAGAGCVCLAAALAGCAVSGRDVESLLRAPQLSGEGSAVVKALNSYLGSGITATLKYPAQGEFLSPFLFGDWDGDGDREAAVLYTADTGGANVWLAILESAGDNAWRVSQTAEGLSGEVESVATAHLRDADSLQIITGYGSAQGDRYLAVYQYSEETLQPVIRRAYTDRIVADMTGGEGTQDLVLALPTETENGGVNLELLTFIDGEFRAKQTLAVGAGSYNGCAALHAGAGPDGKPWLILDGKVGTGGNTLASSIIQYDDETGFLQLYNPPGVWDLFSATLRYDTTLLSCDVDGSGSVDIPSELDDGGTLVAPLDKRLRFVLWKDYATPSGGCSRFGVYDGEYRFFVPLPESLHGSVTLRENAAGTGWLVCSADGTSLYAELRVVPPAEDDEPDGGYTRVGNIGDQQLQVRILTPYYGLTVDRLREEIVMMG